MLHQPKPGHARQLLSVIENSTSRVVGERQSKMLFELGGKVPQVASSAWIAPGAYVIGDVVIGKCSTVWPGAVIRADYAPIRIGENVHMETG